MQQTSIFPSTCTKLSSDVSCVVHDFISNLISYYAMKHAIKAFIDGA